LYYATQYKHQKEKNSENSSDLYGAWWDCSCVHTEFALQYQTRIRPILTEFPVYECGQNVHSFFQEKSFKLRNDQAILSSQTILERVHDAL
jgi:hypothetical protein